MNQLKRIVVTLACGLGGVLGLLAAETPVVKWVPLAELIKKYKSVPIGEVRKNATDGDVLAQHYLGYCYVEGERVSRDAVEGEKWYLRAMQAGYLSSASNLGFLYQRGLLGTNDYVKAISFFRHAADRGLDQAQVNLGIALKQGLAGAPDPQEAKRWFQLAADQGHPVAMVELGRCYRFGLGVEKNTATAADWFERAVREKNSTLAQLNLGLLFEAEDEPAKAVDYFERAAKDGNAEAMVQLYCCYWGRNGVTPDRAKAMEWLTKAAAAKNPYAECLMGYRCETVEWVGEGRDRHLTRADYQGALRWYRRSAEQGWAGGQYHLGMMYLAGKAVAPDEARALELIRAAAAQNLEEAVHQLAELYACGIGEPRNDSERPVALLERIGKWRDLQLRYEHGLGTDRDLMLAARCYCKMVINSKWNHSGADLAKMIEYRPELGNPIGTPLADPIDRHLTLAGPPHRIRTDASDDVLRTLSIYLKSVRGDGTAAFRIGEHYEKGLNTPKSGLSAWAWFSVAAQNGNPAAGGKLAALAGQMSRDEMQQAQQRLASLQTDLKEIAPYLR